MESIESILRQMKRNPFFLPSGFTGQEKVNISENKSTAKRMNDRINFRKRRERRIMGLRKIGGQHTCGVKKLLKSTRATPQWIAAMEIQRGFDLAKEWGYDGFDRTYHPTLVKAR